MLPADALIRRTGATPLTRRSLFAGAGATATVLALAACDDTPTGTQEATVDGPAATLSERSEEHTSELQSRGHLVCHLLLDKNNRKTDNRAKLERTEGLSYHDANLIR